MSNDATVTAVGVDWIVRRPKRIIVRQYQIIPRLMFWPWVFLTVTMHVLQIGTIRFHGLLLLIASSVIAAIQVGIVDDTRAPATTAVIVPAKLGNDVIKVAAERIKRRAINNGFIYRLPKIAEYIIAIRTSNHKRIVMFFTF